MTSLYEQGWRQGSIVEAVLPLHAVVLGQSAAEPHSLQEQHDCWVVASQDCDLDLADVGDNEPHIELRPVYVEAPPTDLGIRSRRLLLNDEEYIVATSPRPIVSAALLTALVENGANRRLPDEARRLALMTWLGLRYDRPAVPPELLPLARRIADAVARRKARPTGQKVRDILMQFDETMDPPHFSLFAVLVDSDDEQTVREWLAEIAQIDPS